MTEHQILRMKLGNRGNFCYANSVLKALLFLSCVANHVGNIFGECHSAFLVGLVRRACKSIVHLWMHPLWLGLMRGWSQPSRQHDAAEFLQFLCGKTLINRPGIELSWRARCQEGTRHPGQVTDSGSSAPLLLPSPGEISEDSVVGASVQGLINKWHEQERTHAMFVPSEVLMLQLCRFHFETDGVRAVKRRYKVKPDRVITVPLFVDNLRCHSCPDRLNSYIIHLGEAPDHGHYHNVFCSSAGPELFHGDDGASARQIDATEAANHSKDVYLLFYVAHHDGHLSSPASGH